LPRDSLKVLLISPNNPFNCYRVPAFPKWASWFTHNMHFGQGGVFPGLNLAILASLTPSDIEVRIIDESVEPIDFEADCDLVGVTAMTNMAPAAYYIADKFRARGKTVVLGGVHVTVCPDEAAPHADALSHPAKPIATIRRNPPRRSRRSYGPDGRSLINCSTSLLSIGIRPSLRYVCSGSQWLRR